MSATTIDQELINNKLSTKELEKELIKSLAGNYRVNFKFAETFAPDRDYKYYDRHFSSAKEVAFVIEETENKISIQHILFISKDHLIKHWRQDWIYENTEILSLVKDHEWEKITLTPEQAKGTWTQKVYQVDDCPRYEGYGTWVHVDGRHFWESTADAALPRREISTNERTDYNVLRRHSHIEIFGNGSWVLEQDNEKIHKDENLVETLICMEKGLETFTLKTYDAAGVMEWWKENENFWADVRKAWSDIIESQDRIKVIEDEKLYMAQIELAKQFSGEQYNSEKSKAAIKELLAQHIEG